MSYFDQLRGASFRGAPFKVRGAESDFGRRKAVHEYPFRDTAWVEDLGRNPRQFEIAGFLIGDDVIAQREQLVEACEAPGEGQLVHPTFGTMMVSLMRFSQAERYDRGRYFELRFTFIEPGARVFPAALVSTLDGVLAAADAADLAAAGDFVARVSDALQQGAAVVDQAVTTAAIWARKAQRLGNDATNLHHMVQTLQGSYGRYFGGRNKGGFSSAVQAVTGTASSVSSLIAQGTAARSRIGDAASAVTNLAGGLRR